MSRCHITSSGNDIQRLIDEGPPAPVCVTVGARLTARKAGSADDAHGCLRGADLQETLAGTDSELRLSIDATSLSESSNLWYSLQAPFSLSVPVRMQVAVIESHHVPYVTSPVLTRTAQTSEIVA